MRTLPSASIGLLLAALLWPGLLSRGASVHAGTAVRMDVPELVQNAGLILEGRVLAAHAVEAATGIETEYLLEVDRTFEGDDLPHRLVRIPGGVLADGRGLMLAGMPRIIPGEEILLFLSEEGPTGARVPVGLSQGKYRIVRRRNGTRVVVRDAAGVALLSRRDGKMIPRTSRLVEDYGAMVAEIEAALTRKRSR